MAAKRVRAPDLREWKRRGDKMTMLTAYDASMARIFDRAGIDVLLVGDSLGMVIEGCENTLQVTLDAMVHHARAVSRGATRALVVADMPFLTYQIDPAEAVRNAGRLIQQGGAAAVKLEGGRGAIDVVRRLVDTGIPVMGHVGLMPQHVHQLGGFRRQAQGREGAERLIEDARSLEQAGAFAVVLESIPESVAKKATAELSIPTFGIGAGPYCDGQVLVSYDMLGLFDGPAPPFAKQYGRIGEAILEAVKAYGEDVRTGRFPAAEKPLGASALKDA